MFRKLNFKVSNKILFVLAIFGIFFSGLAYYFGFLALPGIVDDKIWEMKVLKEGTEQWGMFMKMPFPFTFKVYIYNIKNPDDIMEGAKPVMEELGPFVYKVYKWKSEVKRDEMDGEISYNEYQRYEFDKEASGKYNEDDVVTVMNSPYLTMFYKVQDLQPQMVPMLDQSTTPIFGENDGPFMKVKVSDYMFKGVKICEHGAKDDMLANMACKEVAKKKNNSHLGRFTIKSGLQKKEDAGTLTKYDGKPYTKIWKGGNSICNKIRGVTTIFPTKVNQNMTFDAYSEDICRSMTLAYQRPEVVKGVTGFRFVVKNDTFDYSEEENQCFCTNQTKDASPLTGCMKNGLCDLSTCTGGPVILSFPHLLYADPEHANGVDGLKPNQSDHETFVVLEPLSGFPLKLAQRVQFNIFLRPIDGASKLQNSTILDDKLIGMLNTKLFKTLKTATIIKWFVMISGLGCTVLSLCLYIYKRCP
ncbi:unnamed protein product [Callosobruchus maculatus]|uniref:Sensory neuron membrane protein 2 n=1 Tax=Callosobruchus maculatus TaxID=64391 RepID=A0A653BV50_CALMS|nr:unnamed protein product [Callosobruchus maculatus]